MFKILKHEYKKARKITILLLLFYFLIGLILAMIVPQKLIIYILFGLCTFFSIERFYILGDWKTAIKTLESIDDELVKSNVISNDIFEQIVADIIERQYLISLFKKDYKVKKLMNIERLDNKSYISTNEEISKMDIAIDLRINIDTTNYFLSKVFKNNLFWKGKGYFYSLHFKMTKLNLNK